MTTPEIPDFELIRQIGSGGFGQVWLATNRTTGHLRAIKLIPLQQRNAASAATREIGSLTRLVNNPRCHHPNLLPIHHVGQTATHLYYVMDPADDISGKPASADPDYQPATLQAMLQKGSLRSEKPSGTECPTYKVARQLLAALRSLHAAGMVHRDVKPANCLFVEGQLKLADFGLVTEANPMVSRIGTQKYMPPDGRMDMRADVYAAGLVLYEMLTGLPVDDFPRLGPTARELAEDPVQTTLLHLLLRACEREPERRFADAREMLAALDQPVETLCHRSKRRRPVAIAMIGLLAVIGGGVWAMVPTRVAVSFITTPYEATIYLDDVLQVDADGAAYRTPCTIDGLAATTRRVAFEREDGPRWDAGAHDLAETRQIASHRP